MYYVILLLYYYISLNIIDYGPSPENDFCVGCLKAGRYTIMFLCDYIMVVFDEYIMMYYISI